MVSVDELGIEILSTEVTQELFEIVTGKNPSTYEGDFLPVHCISYDVDSDNAIVEFCNKLIEMKGLQSVYVLDEYGYVNQDFTANGFRLPTKDEWEAAAKGKKEFKYSGSDNLEDVAWYRVNSGMRIHPVAQKKSNEYGLYDMNGNILERTCDDYSLISRYFMGGCWYSDASDCYSKQCNGIFNDEAYGFRIVCKKGALEKEVE